MCICNENGKIIDLKYFSIPDFEFIYEISYLSLIFPFAFYIFFIISLSIGAY